MKHCKKIASLVIVLVLVLGSLTFTASAAPPDPVDIAAAFLGQPSSNASTQYADACFGNAGYTIVDFDNCYAILDYKNTIVEYSLTQNSPFSTYGSFSFYYTPEIGTEQFGPYRYVAITHWGHIDLTTDEDIYEDICFYLYG